MSTNDFLLVDEIAWCAAKLPPAGMCEYGRVYDIPLPYPIKVTNNLPTPQAIRLDVTVRFHCVQIRALDGTLIWRWVIKDFPTREL